MIKNLVGLTVLMFGFTGVGFAQDGNLQGVPEGVTVKSALADIQGRVDKIQTLSADLEFDRKDSDGDKKKKKNKPVNPNPAWPEPPGRDVERGPLNITRGTGAKAVLERKQSKEIFVANASVLWKYDVKHKEAQKIPASWPIINDYVANALKMNVFVAMDDSSLKLKGIESVDGVSCWVIEGSSPSSLSTLGVESTKMKLWIGREDGIPRVIKVPKEKDTIIRLKNVKLNQPIEGSIYQFTPPAGVSTKNIFGF